MFATSHSLARFEERIDTDKYNEFFEFLLNRIRKNIKAEPTSLDILIETIYFSEMEYAKENDFIYYKTRFGIIVLQQVEDVFVVLTFLTFDMVKQKSWLKWKKIIGIQRDDPMSFGDTFKMKTVNIQLVDTEDVLEEMLEEMGDMAD